MSSNVTTQATRATPAHGGAGDEAYLEPSFLRRLTWVDWLFALALAVGAGIALSQYAQWMDGYDKAVLIGAVPAFALLGWHWKPVRPLMLGLTVLSLFAIQLYQGQLARADQVFFLKYLLSSQSAILWMSALVFLSTLFYWVGLATRSDTGYSIGSKLCWGAIVLGFTGMLVRWYESYLIGHDVGHIPVSNLYEVFVLFTLVTSLFYLYYEGRYATRALGPFVMLVVSAAVGFLLWYTVSRNAQEIQPLVPALQSWWMKIHVPANLSATAPLRWRRWCRSRTCSSSAAFSPSGCRRWSCSMT